MKNLLSGCFPRDVGEFETNGRDYSMAMVQANRELEDQCQVEFGSFGAFVGVYDGHGGPHAARFVRHSFFNHFQAILAGNDRAVTAETINRVFSQIERAFKDVVNTQPNLATVGTSCLVGVVSQQTLFVANVGESRVVLGKKIGETGGVAAIQLSKEHNANIEEIRQELRELHPNDPQIVVLKHGVWRVKGFIQVSRSIGDIYLKHASFNKAANDAKSRVPQIDKPVLSATPSILSHPLDPNDSFLIFASDGLWEHLSNEKAVEIVHNHPRAVSAKRLIKAALQEAARKRDMRYSQLRPIDVRIRRHFHDDITVIVLFLNHALTSRGMAHSPPLSVRSPLDIVSKSPLLAA